MNICIRQATPADQPHLLRWTMALQAYETTHGKAMLTVSENIEQHIAQWLIDLQKNSNTLILIAEADGVPVGFILGLWQAQPNLFTIYQSHGCVQLIWVDDDYRQHGVAAQLLNQMTAVLKELGAGYIEIQHIAAHIPAVHFWQKQGYEPCGIIRRKFL